MRRFVIGLALLVGCSPSTPSQPLDGPPESAPPVDAAADAPDAGCGRLGEHCCENFACADPRTACTIDYMPPFTCVACGAENAICCTSAPACDSTGDTCVVFADYSLCQACGAHLQPCCDNQMCRSGLECHFNWRAGAPFLYGYDCFLPPTAGCGGAGQPCCDTAYCNPGLVCPDPTMGSPSCQPCGALGQLCCAQGECAPGARCAIDPFPPGHCVADVDAGAR